ncbi:MAG: DUF401 family protein [Nitrososphaeria archaeon]
MDLILGVLGLVLGFGLVVVMVIKHVNYGLALTVGALVLGFSFGSGIEGYLKAAYLTVTDVTTLELVLAVSLIPILAQSLIDTGIMDGLISGLKSVLPQNGVLATIPAVFGLFPMMGGALISAPLIDEEASRLQVNAEKKAIINLWFRHIWFFVSPLVTTLIIVGRLTGVNIYSVILINLPIFAVHLGIGYFVLLKPLKSDGRPQRMNSSASKIFKGVLPIASTIAVNVLGAPLSVSLVVGISLALLIGRSGLKSIGGTIRTGFKWTLVAAVLGAMYFRYTVRYNGVDGFIVSYAKLYGFPMIAFFTVMPLIFGFITAEPQSSAIMSASLVASAFNSLSPAQVSLLYVSSFIAYFVSPLHLCMILTVGYFKSKLKGVYVWLIPFAMVDYAVCLLTGFAFMSFNIF